MIIGPRLVPDTVHSKAGQFSRLYKPWSVDYGFGALVEEGGGPMQNLTICHRQSHNLYHGVLVVVRF